MVSNMKPTKKTTHISPRDLRRCPLNLHQGCSKPKGIQRLIKRVIVHSLGVMAIVVTRLDILAAKEFKRAEDDKIRAWEARVAELEQRSSNKRRRIRAVEEQIKEVMNSKKYIDAESVIRRNVPSNGNFVLSYDVLSDDDPDYEPHDINRHAWKTAQHDKQLKRIRVADDIMRGRPYQNLGGWY